MGWLVSFGIVFLLAVLPLGVRIRYEAGGRLVNVIAGPGRFTVYPMPKREKKEKKQNQEKNAEKPAQQENQEAKPKQAEKPLPQPPQPPKQEKNRTEKGGSLMDFLPLVKVALDLLNDFRRKLRLDDLYLRLILASSDPCDLAINYGKTWAAVGNFLPVLEQIFVIKKRDVEVECDFTASETKVIARLDITITLGRLLALVAVYGFRAMKEYLAIRNKRKGGAAT